eukprot:m.122462 g.122462  ORF g.122462 m.122462 type:complete len:477 (+) comp13733_c0_seq1:74-1504(+)
MATSEENIQVFVRVRPMVSSGVSDCDPTKCLHVEQGNTIRLDSHKHSFTYDHVIEEQCSQADVFGKVGKTIIDNCLEGYNGTIFAYGQTGSGKTFSMIGGKDESDNIIHEQRGIIPRAMEYLFSLIEREQAKRGKDNIDFVCSCSFLEIYNERIFDLLDSNCTGKQLRERGKQDVYVEEATEVKVETPAQAMDVLATGNSNRRVAETSMNRESSRSHAIFTMAIKCIETGEGGLQNIRQARLNLIDLAGSERQRDTLAEGARLREAGQINKSLSTLGNVITSLVSIANGKPRHVPYRDSKLTFLLRDSLGGNTKTYILAAVNPTSRSFGETLSTLKFAQRAKMIKNKAAKNEDVVGNVRLLQAEVKRLQEQLAAFTSGDITGMPVVMAAAAAAAGCSFFAASDSACKRLAANTAVASSSSTCRLGVKRLATIAWRCSSARSVPGRRMVRRSSSNIKPCCGVSPFARRWPTIAATDG